MLDIENKIISVVEKLDHELASSESNEILKLVKMHGEYGIALENLCSILEKRAIPISTDLLEEIIELFRLMDFSNDVLVYYRKHLVTCN